MTRRELARRVALAALLAAGCAAPARLERAPEPSPAGRATVDRELATRVERTLALDPALHDAVILAEARAGRVTLSGVVPSWQARSHAIEAALTVPGVLSVRSRLKLEPQ